MWKLGGYTIWNKIIKVTLLREGRLLSSGVFSNLKYKLKNFRKKVTSFCYWVGHGFRTRIDVERQT